MLKKCVIILLGACIVVVSPTMVNFFTMPITVLLKGAAAFERQSTLLIEKASVFDPEATLRRLQDSSMNQPYYLFDEHIAVATYDGVSAPGVKKAPQPSSTFFDFEGSDPSSLVFHNADHKIRDGICSIQPRSGAHFESQLDLSLPLSELSALEIRLKVLEGKDLLLGLSSNPEALWSDRDRVVKDARVRTWSVELKETCTIPLAIIPDGNFHTYTVNLETALTKSWVAFDDRVRKLFVRLPEVSGSEVQIDYIRFVTNKEKYTRSSCGTAYVKKNIEYRQIIYMNTPGSLRYKVTVPPVDPYLSFGAGVLMPNDPVDFTVSLEVGGHTTLLSLQTAANPEAWSRVNLDLSDYAGMTVDIVFSASSGNGNIAFWSNPVLYALPRKRFNVVIVLEDALRADHLSMYGYSARNTSPARDKIAKNGVAFDYAFSQATATRPSCPSFMTSLFPTAAGVGLSHEALSDCYVTLAEILRCQGFATAAFSQNQNAGYYNGLHQGFGSLYALENPRGDRSAADVYGEQLNSWLDDIQGRNFFLYLHIMDPHGPYDAPAPFDAWYRESGSKGATLARDPASDPAWVERPTETGRRLLYDGAIRSNDYWFERFIDMLETRDLLSNTLIVFMADHGEYLGERGRWSHAPPGYIQGIRVPLFMVYPARIPAGKRFANPVQLLDVMPTILDLAGIDTDQLVLQGDSIMSLIDGSRPDFWNSRICFSEEVINRIQKMDERPFGSIIFGRRHLLNSMEFLPTQLREKKTFRLPFLFKGFDLIDDPSEDKTLTLFYADPLSKLLAAHVMKKFHRANQQLCGALSGQRNETVTIDPVVQERLRALGYLQ